MGLGKQEAALLRRLQKELMVTELQHLVSALTLAHSTLQFSLVQSDEERVAGRARIREGLDTYIPAMLKFIKESK